MEKIIEKISNYHIFNHLVPGILFIIISVSAKRTFWIINIMFLTTFRTLSLRYSIFLLMFRKPIFLHSLFKGCGDFLPSRGKIQHLTKPIPGLTVDKPVDSVENAGRHNSKKAQKF